MLIKRPRAQRDMGILEPVGFHFKLKKVANPRLLYLEAILFYQEYLHSI